MIERSLLPSGENALDKQQTRKIRKRMAPSPSPERPLRSLEIAWGPFSANAGMYSVVKEEAPQSHLYHKEDMGAVKELYRCEQDGTLITRKDLARGFQADNGKIVTLSDEQLKAIDSKRTKAVQIDYFTPAQNIHPIFYEGSSYYLAPAKKGVKRPFIVLREALAYTNEVAIARFVYATREHLYSIMPFGPLLLMLRLRQLASLRNPEELIALTLGEKPPTEKEESLTQTFIQALTQMWDPVESTDSYATKLKKAIEKAASGKALRAAPTRRGLPTPSQEDSDFMERELEKVLAALQKEKEEKEKK